MLRRFFASIRKRPPFLIATAVMFGLGVLLTFFGHSGSGSGQISRELAAAMGEALFVGALVALLVDPLTQRQFATEWGRDVYWAIFSPNAPQEFKDGLQALAAPTGYLRRCTYKMRLSHHPDGYLDLDLTIRAEGVVLDRHGYRPRDQVFIVARHDGRHSRYLSWSLTGETLPGAEYSEAELENLGVIKKMDSGRTILDQALLPDSIGRVPFGKSYEAIRKLQTSVRLSDYLPMFQNRIVLHQVIQIEGDALEDLELSVAQFGGDSTFTQRAETRPDGRKVMYFEKDSVSFPGQNCLVEWKPKQQEPS